MPSLNFVFFEKVFSCQIILTIFPKPSTAAWLQNLYKLSINFFLFPTRPEQRPKDSAGDLGTCQLGPTTVLLGRATQQPLPREEVQVGKPRRKQLFSKEHAKLLQKLSPEGKHGRP